MKLAEKTAEAVESQKHIQQGIAVKLDKIVDLLQTLITVVENGLKEEEEHHD